MRYFSLFLLFLINESLMSHNLGLHISLWCCSDYICKPAMPGLSLSFIFTEFVYSSAVVTCGLWALCKRPLFIVTLRKNITRDKYFIRFCDDNVVTMFLIEQSIWSVCPKLQKFFVHLPSAQAKFQPLFSTCGEKVSGEWGCPQA